MKSSYTICEKLGYIGIMWEIGKRLRERREAARLDIGQIVSYEGISKSYVSQLETGKNKPNWDLLARLARRYKTSTDYLLGLTDDPTPPARKEGQIMPHLPLDNDSPLHKEAVTQISRIVRDLELKAKEEAARDMMQTAMKYLEKLFGEEAAEDFYQSVDLFRRTGDDSALATWLSSYLGHNQS